MAVTKLRVQRHLRSCSHFFVEMFTYWQIYNNWKQLLDVAQEVSSSYSQDKLVFLVPLVTALEPGVFTEALIESRWQPHALRLYFGNIG
jgi:hypothetical protein